MHPRADLSPALIRLARRQAGVLSRSQLLQAGLSPAATTRICASWTRLARGVYWMGSEPARASWLAGVWAGILVCGHEARAAGLTAAALDGLAGADETRGSTEILVPHGRQVRPQPGYTFVREREGVRLASSAREPRRTRIEDTTLDLCARGDAQAAVGWLTRACQRRLTTPSRLRQRAEQRPTLRHRGLVLDVLADVENGATSVLEHRALTEVVRPHRLPVTALQYRTGSSGRIADAAIVEYRVMVEFDGRIGHVEEGSFRDRRRDNAHTLEGWTTLRFGWSDVVQEPCAVAAQIARLLTERGWPGPFQRCPRCKSGLG